LELKLDSSTAKPVLNYRPHGQGHIGSPKIRWLEQDFNVTGTREKSTGILLGLDDDYYNGR
jgi:hypothetical protein